MINFDYSFLLNHYQTRYGGGALPESRVKAPTPPWSTEAKPSELVKAALSGKKILDVSGAKNALPGAEEDYAELFALYGALNTLHAVAGRADAKGVDAIERSMLERRFATGMDDVKRFLADIKLDKLKLVQGDVTEKMKSEVGVKRDSAEYVTGVVHRGDWSSPVAAFQGPVQFSMKVDKTAAGRVIGTSTINFDLAEMGTATRSIGAVVNYMNDKLAAAGVTTRFTREKLPAEPRTVQVGGKTVTLPALADQWIMKVKGDLNETVTFGAPASADAVYMARQVGKLDPNNAASQSRELLKIQTDVVTGTPPAAFRPPDQAHYIEGQVFKKTLDGDVAVVRASAAHTDGSVYMLAEVTGTVDGQPIKGERDVQLLKYDSVGNLVFSRTLGAADQATASSIAVAADGKVAIAGSVTGDLLGLAATETTLNAAGKDSFVTVFDAEGQELWSKRRGAYADDEVKSLTFAADGSLYVAGTAKSAMPGETAVGGTDVWIRGYGPTVTTVQPDDSVKTDAALKFTTQYGTVGTDGPSGIATNGTDVVVAAVENGQGVLRRFTLNATGDPTQADIRNIGDLMGGDIAGVGYDGAGNLLIAGTTRNGALDVNRVNGVHGGGRDAFVMTMNDQFRRQNQNEITYLGGAGEDRVTSMAIRNGQVWIAGSSTADAGALGTKMGATDGFLARIDPTTGAVGFSRRFSGKDGEVAPTSIAVSAGGASVLDRLGLPKGTIDYTGSQLVTAASSARAGDRMYVKVGEFGRPTAVTLQAGDTLKMLADRINRAIGFNGKATVVKDGAYERIQIQPRDSRTAIEISSGDGKRNLVEAMGLQEGVVRAIARDYDGNEIVPRGGKTYGLKLAGDLNLDSKVEIKRAIDELNTAMVSIRSAYRDLADALKPKKPDMTGEVPAYLQAQLKNYQDGLNRLMGGG